MTFAEIAVLILVIAFFYTILSPLRRWIEKRLFKIFRGRRRGTGQIIDITDFTKKTDPPK